MININQLRFELERCINKISDHSALSDCIDAEIVENVKRNYLTKNPVRNVGGALKIAGSLYIWVIAVIKFYEFVTKQ